MNNNGHDRSAVYIYIARQLKVQGYYQYQYSCFRSKIIALIQAQNDANDVTAEVKARFPPARPSSGNFIVLH